MNLKGEKKTKLFIEFALIALLLVALVSSNSLKHTTFSYLPELIFVVCLPALLTHSMILLKKDYQVFKWFKMSFVWLLFPAIVILLGGDKRGSGLISFDGLMYSLFAIIIFFYLMHTYIKFKK